MHGTLTAGRKAAALVGKNYLDAEETPAPSSMASKNGKSGKQKPPSKSTGEPAEPAKEPEPLARIPATIDMVIAKEPGLIGNLERIKIQEVATSTALLRAKIRDDISAVVILSERHLHESKALASAEQAALNYRVRVGELGPRADMKAVYERIIIGVKNAVLGMATSIIPQIIPHLTDSEKAHEIKAIIDKAARDALRSASTRSS